MVSTELKAIALKGSSGDAGRLYLYPAPASTSLGSLCRRSVLDALEYQDFGDLTLPEVHIARA
jgi:hypothetical protein